VASSENAARRLGRICGKLYYFAILFVCGWLIASALLALGKLPDEIEASRKAYLCVENWKLGNYPASCDDLRNSGENN
jgi:hypothetical protein